MLFELITVAICNCSHSNRVGLYHANTYLRLAPPPTGEDDLAKAAAATAADFSSGLSLSLDRIPPPAAPVTDLGLIVGGIGVLGNGDWMPPAFGVGGGNSMAS